MCILRNYTVFSGNKYINKSSRHCCFEDCPIHLGTADTILHVYLVLNPGKLGTIYFFIYLYAKVWANTHLLIFEVKSSELKTLQQTDFKTRISSSVHALLVFIECT